MQEHRVRLTSTDSVFSVDTVNKVDVELKQHTKVFPFPSVSETIDQMQIFENERNKASKYRLILTINPFCTNVLFNALTEVVKDEGSEDVVFVRNVTKTDVKDAVGKNSITNYDAVRNTEYSNYGFKYHCGYDIFNNHILRNQSFKLVNKRIEDDDKNIYNTIEDYMRYADGEKIPLYRREYIGKIILDGSRHLYLREDILSYIDCINANLTEQNGWWGFYNRSSIPSTEFKNDKWEDLKVSKVFNDETLSCGFIEMYPDSSLYSFNPKYNTYKNREEQNWDICITYPFENDEGYVIVEHEETKKIEITKPLICGINSIIEEKEIKAITDTWYDEEGVKHTATEKDIGNIVKDYSNSLVNGLLVASYEKTIGTSGQDIILFRSFVKHNLNVGDTFKLFYSEGKDTKLTEIKDKLFRVINVGNLDDKYQEYYFYINDVEDLEEELGIVSDEITDKKEEETDENDTTEKENEVNEEEIKTWQNSNFTFRFVKVVKGFDCRYYYRKFRKLPNFRYKQEELTDEVARNKQKLEEYIEKNCKKEFEINGVKESKMQLFNKEQYPLAFAKTYYGDNITQVTFTDSIELDRLVDNLGRPLTEFYVTILKRNKGYNDWYTNPNSEEIEFSHCFGKLTSGVFIHNERDDMQVIDDRESILSKRRRCNDVGLISSEKEIFGLGGKDEDITLEDTDDFYGDLVEFDTANVRETTIGDVCFRFNTNQRSQRFDKGELKFYYDEIETDDYDKNGFEVKNYNMDEQNHKSTTFRPEGYYYKPHYPIRVRDFGRMHQGSYQVIKISECRPRQAGGLYIEVSSPVRTGVNTDSVLYLCNLDDTSQRIPLTVNSVINPVRFLINPLEKPLEKKEEDDKDYYSVYDIVTHINSGKFELRLKNVDVPDYAYESGDNLFFWRDVLSVGDMNASNLKEYPFANGHFYINKEINFFLKRQDPFGWNNLQASDIVPNDIYGNTGKVSNYEYKDETNTVC